MSNGLETPPFSLGAEAAVLGSMLIERAAVEKVIDRLQRECFYDSRCRAIFESIRRLHEANPDRDIDALLARSDLADHKELDGAGGVEFLGSILDSVPTAANAEYYCDIVIEKYRLRALLNVCGEVRTKVYEGDADSAEIVDFADQQVTTLARGVRGGRPIETLAKLGPRAYTAIEARSKGPHVDPTGLEELDGLLGTLLPGDMCIIGARPSMGKTALGVGIALHWAGIRETPVLYVALEGCAEQITERVLAWQGLVSCADIRRGTLNERDFIRLLEAMTQLAEAPLSISDSPRSPAQVRSAARSVFKGGPGLLIVDYLQLMSDGKRHDNRQGEVAAMSRHLKETAIQLQVPAIILSQLNRAPEGRTDGVPRLSDLRESGAIEQDADQVILMHRKDYYHRHEPGYQPDHNAMLIIAKNRNGPTGVANATFAAETARFENSYT